MDVIHKKHDNLLDVSAFDMPIRKTDNPTLLLRNLNNELVETPMDNQVVVYRPDTMEILGRSRSNKYKIVEPTELYTAHAKKLIDLNESDLKEVIIDDYVFEGGRKQQRTITYPRLKKQMDDGSKVSMRNDIFNSVDMSWMYQAFAGAYRDLCRNTLVFGGQRMYHIKQKHTTGLNVASTLKSVTNTIKLFSENQELMNQMLKQEIDLKTMVHILANNICKKSTGKAKAIMGEGSEVTYNYKLLDYFIDKIEQEQGNLGLTVWNLYNALTYWSTHIDDTFERLDSKGVAKEIKMSRAGSKEHTARTKREDKVREFLNSDDWQALLNNTYVFTSLHPNLNERFN